MKKKTLLLCLAAVLLLTVLPSCGGENDGEDDTDAVTETEKAEKTEKESTGDTLPAGDRETEGGFVLPEIPF